MGLNSLNDKVMAEFSNRNPNAAFDPALILVIAEIIKSLLAMFQDNCGRNPSDAVSKAKNPGFFGKALLNIKVRQALGFKGFRKHGSDVMASILKVGGEVSVSEMQAAYDELDQM